MRSTTSRKRGAFTLLAILSSIGFSLLLVELALRILRDGGLGPAWASVLGDAVPHQEMPDDAWVIPDPVIGYRLAPNRTSTNSLGLRNPEITPTKPPGVKRLIVLGDSVSADPDGYVAILRERLAGQYQVINGAVPGYTTYQERLYYERHLAQLGPDIVLLQYCVNDNHRFLHRFNEEANMLITEEAYRALAPEGDGPLAWLSQHSYLALRLRIAVFLWRSGAQRHHWERTADTAAAWRDDSWPDLEAQITALQTSVRQDGAKLMLVVPPYLGQLDHELPVSDIPLALTPQRKLAEIAQKLDTPILDLYRDFQREGPERVFRDSLHLSLRGHQVTADAIAAHLAKLGWIDD